MMRRGPDVGLHVAPFEYLMVYCLKCMDFKRFQTRDLSHQAYDLAGSGLPNRPPLDLVNHYEKILFELEWRDNPGENRARA